MTVFTLQKTLPDSTRASDLFNGTSMSIIADGMKPKSLSMANEFGNQVVYSGTGFAYGDGITGGTVTKVTILDAEDNVVMTITGMKAKLVDLDLSSVRNSLAFLEGSRNIFNGTNGSDYIVLEEGKGSDTINARGGDDYIRASMGKNVYDGGAGIDQLDYSQIFANSMKVNLAEGEIVNPYGKLDKVTGIESVTGSVGADTFIGSKKADRINGFVGDDIITGGKGDDVFAFIYNGGTDTYKDFGNGKDSFYILNDTATFEEILEKASQVGRNVEIDFGGGDKIVLQKYDLDDLKAEQFDFLFG